MSGPGAKRYSVRSSQPSSKKKRTSYSHITAADVVQCIRKEELIKKFKPMLTDHRTVLLEDRDLIDSDCRYSIQAKLRSGQRAGAATELVEYFEDNHDGDKMMEFCTFLEDQAGNRSPLLVQLASTIRECVETLSAEVFGPSEVQRASNPKVVSYSHVRAKDVIKSFEWGELRKDIEDMMTKSRVDTLEKGYNLIDSPCNAKIEAQLTNGDPPAAATTLLKYLEKTHKGDGMLQFCRFLRDEAKEAGGSAVLEDLANRIERAVKDLGATQEPLPSNPLNVDLPVGTPAAVSRDSTIIQYSTDTPLAGPSDNLNEPSLPPLVEHLLDKALLDRLYPLGECKDSTPGDSEVEDSGPDGDSYPMNTYPRGPAIIINNEKFQAESGLKNRPGTKQDGKALQHLFTSSGFVTTTFNDLTAGRMQQVLQSYGQRNHTKAQCLIVAILTHGREGGSLYGVDGGLVKVKTLTEFFTGRNCPSLVGKPKLFFIQACRGKKHDSAVRGYEETDNLQQTNETSDGLKEVILPSQSDFLLSFSTVEGYVSWRDAQYGTWYVRDLVEVFTMYAAEEHLLDMLIMVNDRVSKRSASEDGSKQTLSVKTELRKKLYFNPGEYDLNHLDREPNWCCIA